MRVLLIGGKTLFPQPTGADAHVVLAKPAPPGELLATVHLCRAGLTPSAASKSAALTPRHRTVLVVDDSEDAQDLICDCLSSAGFTTRSALNGKQALDQLMDMPAPGLITIDLMMPEMSGMELIGVLQSYRRLARVPMLILSAVVVPEAGRLPGVEYLSKPFSNDDLVDTVKRLTGTT